METKICNSCKKEKSITDFILDKRNGKPKGGRCKICQAEYRLKKNGIERTYEYKLRLTMEQIKEIIEKYNSGIGTILLAKEYNNSSQSIVKLLKRHGVIIRTKEENNLLQLKRLEKETGKTLKERRKAIKERKRIKIHNIILEVLKGKCCVDCGENDLLVLEFDHRDPKEKIRDIAKCCTATQLEIELPKCDIVCANCHSRRTQRMFGSWRVEYQKNFCL